MSRSISILLSPWRWQWTAKECSDTGQVLQQKLLQVVADTGRFTVATISRKGGGFIAEVKARPDVVLWEVTEANRDTIPERVVAWLSTLPQDDTTHC